MPSGAEGGARLLERVCPFAGCGCEALRSRVSETAGAAAMGWVLRFCGPAVARCCRYALGLRRVQRPVVVRFGGEFSADDSSVDPHRTRGGHQEEAEPSSGGMPPAARGLRACVYLDSEEAELGVAQGCARAS